MGNVKCGGKFVATVAILFTNAAILFIDNCFLSTEINSIALINDTIKLFQILLYFYLVVLRLSGTDFKSIKVFTQSTRLFSIGLYCKLSSFCARELSNFGFMDKL